MRTCPECGLDPTRPSPVRPWWVRRLGAVLAGAALLAFLIDGVPSHWWADFARGARSMFEPEEMVLPAGGGRLVELEDGPLTMGGLRAIADAERAIDGRELARVMLGQGAEWTRTLGGDTVVGVSTQDTPFTTFAWRNRGWPVHWFATSGWVTTASISGPMPSRLEMPAGPSIVEQSGTLSERRYWHDATGSPIATESWWISLWAWVTPLAGGVLAGWSVWVGFTACARLAGWSIARRVRSPEVGCVAARREAIDRRDRVRSLLTTGVSALAAAALAASMVLSVEQGVMRHPSGPMPPTLADTSLTLADVEAMERGELSTREVAWRLLEWAGEAPSDRPVLVSFRALGTSTMSTWPPIDAATLLRFDAMRRVGDDGAPRAGWRGRHLQVGQGWLLAWWATQGGAGVVGSAVQLTALARMLVVCALAWLLGRGLGRAWMARVSGWRARSGLCVACGYAVGRARPEVPGPSFPRA